ncbi:hypothetical protein AB0B52_31255 [Streptomyces griseofuscus]
MPWATIGTVLGGVAAIVGLFLSEEDARHLFSRFARWDSRY